MGMRLVVEMGILALLTAVRSAHATPSARLVYARSADAASCPNETTLRRAVAARFGYDPFFAWARQTVVVQISRDGRRYTARVQLVDDQGLARGTREIASDEDNCTELFDAAALAISIALDASIASPSQPPEAEPVRSSAPGATGAVSEPPLPSPDLRPRDAVRVVAPTVPGRFRIGLDALAFAGISPNLVPGIAAFAYVRERAVSVGLELQADASIPAAQVSLKDSAPGSGNVESVLVAATVAPCIHYKVGFVCVLGELGRLQAWGGGVSHPSSDAALFAAAGGRVGVELPLSARLFVRFHGDAMADLTPPKFRLDNQLAWNASSVAGTLAAGVGARLP
jgi:hypothetical protein